MSQPIIQIDSIGKSYYLGQAAVRHEMFRDAVHSACLLRRFAA